MGRIGLRLGGSGRERCKRARRFCRANEARIGGQIDIEALGRVNLWHQTDIRDCRLIAEGERTPMAADQGFQGVEARGDPACDPRLDLVFIGSDILPQAGQHAQIVEGMYVARHDRGHRPHYRTLRW